MADRRRRLPLAEQLRPLAPLVVAWGVGVLVISVVVVQNAVPDEQLLLDPTYAGDLPWYTGLVSSLGVLTWTVAACAAVGGSFVAGLRSRWPAQRFLRHGAAVSVLLLLDDLLQGHSQIATVFAIPKTTVQLVFPLLVLSWMLIHVDEVLRSRYQLLVAAGVAFAGSIAIDVLASSRTGLGVVAEDGLKLLGVLAWATFFVTTAQDIVRSVAAVVPQAPVVRSTHEPRIGADGTR